MSSRDSKKPSLALALGLIIISVIILSIGILKLGVYPHIPLLFCATIASLAAFKLNYSWRDIQDSIIKGINIGLPSILILMTVGTVIGTWILSGTVQTMIYYGLHLLSPNIFLVATVLICAIVSLATGSSWTTVGTIGVALIGIAQGLNIPLAITAGAIVSGSFFGDKMSPLSDTTNLAPAVAGSKLFEHIKHMFYTVTPSLILSLILYGIIGFQYSGSELDSSKIDLILNSLGQEFYISPILLIPPVLVIILAMKKFPALPTLIAASLLGGIFAMIFQGAGLKDVINAMHLGYQSSTGVEFIDKLLTRGGLNKMLGSASLIIIALAFGGILDKTKVLKVILNKLSTATKSQGGLVLTTVLTCLGVNILLADQYLSIVLPGKMYSTAYKKLKLHPKNLSRVLEDSGTLFNAIVPWGLSGSFIYATLGVSAVDYFIFSFLCLITPIVSIIYAFADITMEKIEE
ncbi:Na+/H+ antiporter NhaC [Orenia marismortui]|uniref:NhaC family Na+:H+ antiporter n=1 Tax=Orenia marismortui TaxID=46469 RepID=A0A4R8HA86_9FIRM|nr:Na+/H+ antiporter NhaC [Orenia marismortui]TDX52312.1 NhaC family Na+:H+ antiporter [Orenia marismortui]